MKLLNRCTVILLSGLVVPILSADELSIDEAEFFESKIRPVLVEHCYDCHNSTDTAEGDLILDHRKAIRAGGQSGSTINFEEPKRSLLLKVIRHEIEDFEMPQGGDKLDDATIADFEKWIRMGAPDPRVDPPRTNGSPVETWDVVREKRKQWWSFQPIREASVPKVKDENWSDNPIDRFILAKAEAAKLPMEARADRRTLIRRLSFVLRGLPPTSKEIESFLDDERPDSYEKLVDAFLNSSEFGEHWARHWMDLVRYSETHGSEGDPAIPFAWKYRDYLIRALNRDVPYDQLLLEHVAGDLLESPRIDSESQTNESIIAPSHWRMCFHGFAPTDALDEKVRFTDDQINVFSKAFLGLTVSCARCHNHKFDPISQADYYALFGIVGSTRPGILDANTEELQNRHQKILRSYKSDIRDAQAKIWLSALANFQDRLTSLDLSDVDETSVLYPFKVIQDNDQESAWEKLKSVQAADSSQLKNALVDWDLTDSREHNQWHSYGNGSAHEIALPGEFIVPMKEDEPLSLLPGGVYSHLLSTTHRAILASPTIRLDGEYEAWVQVAGDGQALLRYVVQNYPRNGTVYPATTLNGGEWKWQRYDLTYWKGDDIHFEITTAADSPVLAKTKIDRSWFGIRRVVVAPKGTFQPPNDPKSYQAVSSQFQFDDSEKVPGWTELAIAYVDTLRDSILAWKDNTATDDQIRFLKGLQDAKLIASFGSDSKKIERLLDRYRQREVNIPLPNRVPGLLEADSADQALFVRGNHRHPAGEIPRRFLEAIDQTPYRTLDSGRLELARDLLRDDNPLTKRVIVNRIWHHLFGAGLVRTVDNFGRLGEEPSHPKLLDFLAIQFQRDDWSIKKMIRSILLTKTWQQSSNASPLADTQDPDNRLLTHTNIRRLDAEMLRDSLLQVSGRLNSQVFGPPIGTKTASSRRSVYLSVIRNSLNSFLQTFDAPVPFATKGLRDVTNVPAQSLTMLNDPFVIESARRLAAVYEADSDRERIEKIFIASLCRRPNDHELSQSLGLLDSLSTLHNKRKIQRAALVEQREVAQARSDAILETARNRILKSRSDIPTENDIEVDPLAAWDFSVGLDDQIGQLTGTLHGDAELQDEALVLRGSGYLRTSPLKQTIMEKTLRVTVQLENLDQRGGGVMTIQDRSGVNFDAIVFGEQKPKHWLAGSNNFRRTESLQGTPEAEAIAKPVQITLTYAADGTIRCYRNGVPYGKAYRKSELQPFAAENAEILFGLRHGSPGGNRMLQGKIFSAQLFDRALTDKEVAAIANGDPTFVSKQEIENELSNHERDLQQAINEKIQELQQQIDDLGPDPTEDQAWADLAHAILNLKEFLYYR